ncbi:MAG: M48 family metallopeptidase [Schlesneria sp.]
MSTNFFQRQDQARKKTGRLLLLFALSVLALIASTYIICLVLFIWADGGHSPPARNPINPPLLLGVTAGVLFVTGCGSLYKIAELSSGGKSVAMLLGGELIPSNTRDLTLRRLLNVVEEMAIASGVPVPPVYLLPAEKSINAFVAGFGPGDAVITVSQGSLEYLSRDELQGVLAHEFSHLLNGDVRLNIRLMGLIFGIVALSIVGQYVIRFAPRSGSRDSDDNKSGMAIFLFGLALIVLGSIGAFFGRLIQAAISRQREFLADASAVQFTRNPDGIAGALKKIGGLSSGSTIKNIHASEACHMFFASGFSTRIFAMLATHPPLDERIRAIDSHWDGKFPQVSIINPRVVGDEPQIANPQKKGPWPVIPGMPQMPLPIPAGMLGLADTAVRKMGKPNTSDLHFSDEFTEGITDEVREIIGEPFSARAAIYALVLSDEPDVREKQLTGLKGTVVPTDLEEMLAVEPMMSALPAGTRLNVAFQSLPALSQMSQRQYKDFRDRVSELIDADQKVSLFEFCLQRVVCHHLDQAYGLVKPPPVRFTSLTPLNPAASIILGLIAVKGNESSEEALKSYTAGFQQWNNSATAVPAISACSRTDFARALYQFEQATPQLKERLIRACATCICSNRQVTAAEYELLRTICSSLDCPLPPLTIE